MRALAILLLLASPAIAMDRNEADRARIAKYYEAALQLYAAGNYSRAITEWQNVLLVDAAQKTAKSMTRQAREKIDKRDKKEQAKIFNQVRRGKYYDAYLTLQVLLERDATHPLYRTLERRLELLTEIIKRAPAGSRAWKRASTGLSGYIARKDDLQLAYNGLRYAKEILPREKRFQKAIDLIIEERPTLARDTITPGMKLLPHKRRVALHHIYDGKYNLAVDNLRQVLQLEPNDLVALKRLGSAYYQLRRFKRARQTWMKALTLDPKDKQLKKYLARTKR
ncbi:MAG: tetratricopeptide repeat protein [Elusimicrobiota bacterium]